MAEDTNRPAVSVTCQDGDREYTVKLARATAHKGMTRSIMAYKSHGVNKEDPDDARCTLRAITYPDLICSTQEATGFDEWPVPFDTFLNLPDEFVEAWERGAYTVNPHWNPAGEAEAEAEKKA
jgi:hypothetical protein